MNAREDFLAGRIDRDKARTTRPRVNAARATQIRMEARLDLRKALARYPTPEEQAAYVEHHMDMEAESLWPLLGRTEAMTAFTKRGADIGAFLKLDKAVARARADQLFSKPVPANEDAANDGRGGQ